MTRDCEPETAPLLVVVDRAHPLRRLLCRLPAIGGQSAHAPQSWRIAAHGAGREDAPVDAKAQQPPIELHFGSLGAGCVSASQPPSQPETPAPSLVARPLIDRARAVDRLNRDESDSHDALFVFYRPEAGKEEAGKDEKGIDEESAGAFVGRIPASNGAVTVDVGPAGAPFFLSYIDYCGVLVALVIFLISICVF